MNRKIIFSANEYKEKYNSLLDLYLINGYEDLEQIDFVKSEILLYNNYLNKIYSFSVRAHFSGRVEWQGLENNLDEIDTQLRNKLYNNGNKFDEEIHSNLHLSFTKIIEFLKTQKSNPIQSKTKVKEFDDVARVESIKVKDYKNTIWFKTGILLANGEAFDLYEKYKNDKGHFTRICKELGFKESDRPYFSETINDNPKVSSDKNTFADKGKLQKLHNHLSENGLKFGAEFLKKYDALELE